MLILADLFPLALAGGIGGVVLYVRAKLRAHDHAILEQRKIAEANFTGNITLTERLNNLKPLALSTEAVVSAVNQTHYQLTFANVYQVGPHKKPLTIVVPIAPGQVVQIGQAIGYHLETYHAIPDKLPAHPASAGRA